MTNSVEVVKLSKSYPVYRTGAQRLAELLLLQTVSFHKDFWALENVSFCIAKGESFGLVGVNGSGKSTLLQILAGILTPTRGTVQTQGRISALLELGSGFNPEFSGRENVFLNAAILGMTPNEITRRLPEIEDFAEIGAFIDQPVRTYSSGMIMRLAFSVAIHVDPDILIVDEAIAVGDMYFRQRCLRRVHKLRESGVTILFVSHSPGDVKAFCDRCLWLDGGRVRQMGSPDTVLAEYLADVTRREAAVHTPDLTLPPDERPAKSLPSTFRLREGTHRFGTKRAEVIGATILDGVGDEVTEAFVGATLSIRVTVLARQRVDAPIVGFLVRNARGETIFGTNTSREERILPPFVMSQMTTCDFQLELPELAPGEYGVTVGVANGTLDAPEMCDYIDDAILLRVTGDPDEVRGYLRLACQVSTITC